MGDLIQIAADIAQQGIHFSDMRVVYFIYKSILDESVSEAKTLDFLDMSYDLIDSGK